MKIADIIHCLEQFAAPDYQEEYDNSGLIVGDRNMKVKGVLICLDSTEAVIDEAISQDCNLVVAHHPIIFKGLKRLTGENYVEKAIIKAIKNEISILAMHTNLDNLRGGVNSKLADKLGIVDRKILSPRKFTLSKLISFVPVENVIDVLNAVHKAGAGIIGDYSHCSFRVKGTGRFRPGDASNPHIGKKNRTEEVEEERIEIILPRSNEKQVLSALKKAHPYEEAAYFIQPVDNEDPEIGSGLIGSLGRGMDTEEFLKHIKQNLGLQHLRYTPGSKSTLNKIALCGGSGSFLIKTALNAGADAFITADIKYHEYFNGESEMLLADIGHYESEVFTKELIYELLNKNFSNIALHLSEVNTNPIRYI